MVKVLVVEDEASIREMIALNLRLAGMEAVEADSAEAALPLLEQRPGCDAAILDVMLPGMNGFSLCETIRRTDQKIGIIILSAKGQEQDKIRGLSIGADDYMTKPFSVSELLARVEALCRRVGRSAGNDAGENALSSLVSGSFVLDENRRVLLKAGKPIELTQVEFQIMELFFRNPGVALVRCEDRGCEHPPPPDESGGRAQPPHPYPDGVGLWLPVGGVNLSVKAERLCQLLPFRHLRATSPGRGSLSCQGSPWQVGKRIRNQKSFFKT